MKTEKDAGPKRPGRVLITLPDDLRFAVQKAAFAGNRPVNAEINMRLRASFPTPLPGVGESFDGAAEEEADYAVGEEDQLLEAFRRLSPAVRAALLTIAKAAR